MGESYQYLVGEVKRLPAALRPLYWLYAYGGLDASQLAAVTGEDRDTLAQRLSQGEEQLAQRRASWTKPQRAAYVRLSTQFRDPGGYGFQEARLPVSLLHVLWKELGLPVKPPKERPRKPWTTKRLTVLGIAVGVASLAVAAAVLAFVLLL